VALKDRQDIDEFGVNLIDDPVGAQKNLANVIPVFFWDPAARKREWGGVSRSRLEASYPTAGCFRTILRDVVTDVS
jgi:hypothetical protein